MAASFGTREGGERKVKKKKKFTNSIESSYKLPNAVVKGRYVWLKYPKRITLQIHKKVSLIGNSCLTKYFWGYKHNVLFSVLVNSTVQFIVDQS